MPSRFDQDFAKGFTSTFGNAFSDSSSNWLRMQQLRQEIENNNFSRDQYLQKRRSEEYDRRKAIGKQKKMLEDKKRYLLSNFAERPLPTSGDPVQNVANLDIQEEMLRKRIAEAEDDDELSFIVPEVEQRLKTKAERKQIAEDTEILRELLSQNDEMTPKDKQNIEAFLDGSPAKLKIAQQRFAAWKPEKVDKKTLAEEKAELIEEIWALADDENFNSGFERLRQIDKQKFARASAIGIKKAKEEPNPNDKYVAEALSAFDHRDKMYENMSLREYVPTWLENRRGLIPEDAAKYVMGKLYPERTSLWQPPTNEPTVAPEVTPQAMSPSPAAPKQESLIPDRSELTPPKLGDNPLLNQQNPPMTMPPAGPPPVSASSPAPSLPPTDSTAMIQSLEQQIQQELQSTQALEEQMRKLMEAVNARNR